MKKDEIYRRIDNTGRICIPRDARRQLGIRADDVIKITVDRGAIMLRRHTACCVRCQLTKGLAEVAQGVYLCRACAKALAGE